MAGLVPAISLRRAQCVPKRGHRDKPGDDGRHSVVPGERSETRDPYSVV